MRQTWRLDRNNLHTDHDEMDESHDNHMIAGIIPRTPQRRGDLYFYASSSHNQQTHPLLLASARHLVYQPVYHSKLSVNYTLHTRVEILEFSLSLLVTKGSDTEGGRSHSVSYHITISLSKRNIMYS